MNDKKFESSFKKLEDIVEKLESDELELEQSLTLYEEGIGLARFCSGKLAEAEKKVQKLSKDKDGNFVVQELDAFQQADNIE